MGWLEDLGNNLGLGDLDRGQNEFRDVDRDSFNLPGFSERDAYLNQTSRDFLGRTSPQAAESEFRRYQGRNLDRLNRLANGEDSYTAGQLQLAQDQMARQQMGMAAGAAPGAGAGARRAAMQNIARGNQGLAFNQAQAGIAERQAAIAALGQQSAAARAQDLQRNEFNVGAEQNQTNLNQTGWTAAQQLALQNAQNQQQGSFQYENQRGNRFNGLLTQPTTGERALGAITGAAQMGIQAFGGPAAASSSALSSPGYTPEAFGTPMTLQTGPDAVPYTPSAAGVGYTPGAYNVPMRLAEGGVVTQPTRALVGEAGPEAVIPLAHLPALIERLSQSVGNQGEEARRTKQTARDKSPPTATQVSQAYGPPAPSNIEGPAPPAGAPAWRPADRQEYGSYVAGQDWARARREGVQRPFYPEELAPGKFTSGQWLAFLRGLGVQ